MRRIDRTRIATIQSPIRHLMTAHLETSIFTVAPERESSFDTQLNDFDLIYDSPRRWMLFARPDSAPPELWISRGAVELILIQAPKTGQA